MLTVDPISTTEPVLVSSHAVSYTPKISDYLLTISVGGRAAGDDGACRGGGYTLTERGRGVGLRGVVKDADTPWDRLAVGLGCVGCGNDLSVGISDGEAGCPVD